MLKCLLLLFFSVSGTFFSYAQTKISGTVADALNNKVSNVSISYRGIHESVILGYTISNEDGTFSLNIKPTEKDSLELIFSHLAYQKKTMRVSNASAHYTVSLILQTMLLKEVKVGQVPVFKHKDTINFNVEAFTSKQDQVIGDLIKKLPGIEMDGDKIRYQGKPIQKYMVNNLDLMEGRYGLINNNLPVDAVKNIQVVEHDQPIRILDSLVFSDQASLNIQLKKFSTTGVGKAGIGYRPFLREVNLTPMTFDKTFQTVNSFQTNNIGDDVSAQLQNYSLNNSGILDMSDVQVAKGPSFLNIAELSSPSFDQKKWLDNNIVLFNTNLLKKLEEGLEVKGNIAYYRDVQKREGRTLSSIFTPDRKISLSEAVENQYRSNDLTAGFILNKNDKHIFLKNNFKFHRRSEDHQGNLLLNNDGRILQQQDTEDYGIFNKLAVAKFIGKQLFSINSLISYGASPQSISIEPGPFEAILHHGMPYERLLQRVRFLDFNTQNNIAFTRVFKGIVLTPKLGIDFRSSLLKSRVNIQNGDTVTALNQNFVNDQRVQLSRTYLDLKMQYHTARFKFDVMSPVSIYSFDTKTAGRSNDNEMKVTADPQLLIRYQAGPDLELGLRSNYDNQFSDMSNQYNAYILNSYRNIKRYDSDLQYVKSWRNDVFLNFKNTLKSEFLYVSYSHTRSDRNFILENVIDAQGFNSVNIRNLHSLQESHNGSVAVSKFFSKLKTVLKLNAEVNSSRSDYLLNAALRKQRTWLYRGGMELNNSSFDDFSFIYKVDFSAVNSKLAQGIETKVWSSGHRLDLNVYPANNHSISISGSFYRNNIPTQKHQLFMDMLYRKTLARWKTDLEFSAINLFNNTQYQQRFNSEYSLVESYFTLRPRQFLIAMKFRF